MPMPISETQLVEIIQESLPLIGSMSIRRMQSIQSRMDVDDIMQITAMRAFANREKLTTNSSAEAKHWVRTIGFNAVKLSLTENHCEKRSVSRESHSLSKIDSVSNTGREASQVHPDPKQPDPSSLADFNDELAQVEVALKSIAENQAGAVRLRYFEMAEYEEIATNLDCSVQAARSLVSRGLAAVRAIVK
jgi:RNA polymerase sigma factor (sigma-70 family)